jgi:hypothetical protein
VARVLFSGSDACADSGTWTKIDSFNFHALRAYKEARTGGRKRKKKMEKNVLTYFSKMMDSDMAL